MSTLLDQASLVLIPSGYKEDIVYCPKPTDGSGDLTFTRASDGTRVNSAGLVEVCPWNLALWSEDFSNAIWDKNSSAVLITTNDTTAPNGTLTADKVENNPSSANTPWMLQYFDALVGGQTYTYSIYAKATTSATKRIAIWNNSSSWTYQNISVTTEWQRFEFTFVANASATQWAIGLEFNGAETAYYIWGAQLNSGSTAKPYFPTTDRLNVPRLTYENGCPSLLLEPQRTNDIFPSEDFSGYSGSAATISTNQAISPDGTQNADLIYPAVSGNFAGKYQNVGATTTGVVSCFVKQAGKRYAIIGTDNNSTYTCIFDLQTASVVYEATNYTGSIEALSNGWYRILAVYTSSTAASYPFIGVADNSSGSVVIDGTNGLYIWGFQYERNATYATSYIPTTSSSVTRVADAAYKTGISSLIGGTSGTVFFDITTNPVLSSASYKQFCYYFDASAAQSYMYLNSVNKLSTNINWGSFVYNTPLVANTRYKVALVYAPNDFALYVNGVSVATASSGTPKDNVDLTIGQYSGTEMCEFVFNQYAHFPSRLTNTELAALTTL